MTAYKFSQSVRSSAVYPAIVPIVHLTFYDSQRAYKGTQIKSQSRLCQECVQVHLHVCVCARGHCVNIEVSQ